MTRRRDTGSTPATPAGFWVVWSAAALDLVGFGVVLPLLPLYAEDFGAGSAAAAALIAAFSAAQFVTAPLWGRLSDRIGRRPVLILALVGSCLGSLVTGLAGALWVLFLGRVVDGASGTAYGTAQAAVSDIASPEDRPRLLGLLAAAFGLGFVAGPLIGSLAAIGDDRLPFFVAAGLAALNAVAAYVRVPETKPDGVAVVPDTRRRWLPDADGLSRYAVIALVTTAGFSGFEATFSLLADRRLDLTDSSIAGLFAVIGIVVVLVQTRVVGPVSTRLGPTSGLRVALALLGTGLLVLSIDGGWTSTVVGLVLLVVGNGLVAPLLSSLAVGSSRSGQRGAVLGVQQSAGALGRIVGPVVGGLLFQHVSNGSTYLVAGLLVGAAVALVPPAVVEPAVAPDRSARPV